MKYPLIKKWLGLGVGSRMTLGGKIASDHISADELEAKLAEGLEVYGRTTFSTIWIEGDTHVALAIGKQPIKKQTRRDALMDLMDDVFSRKNPPDAKWLIDELEKIANMKE